MTYLFYFTVPTYYFFGNLVTLKMGTLNYDVTATLDRH